MQFLSPNIEGNIHEVAYLDKTVENLISLVKKINLRRIFQHKLKHMAKLLSRPYKA